ncbi:hypothetical protein Ancab_006847 [Ancistrocladus abbreviatus]
MILASSTLVKRQFNANPPVGWSQQVGRMMGVTSEEDSGKQCLMAEKSNPVRSSGKVLNKKRSYAQFHLELGQSDFFLHTCSVCGIKYAKGDEGDEKVHNYFHKSYTHGIQFKGWRNERVVPVPEVVDKGRVVLVLNADPLAQRNKVQEVVKMMEMELGDGWIFHEQCKVYLFISVQRIAGCVVAEPIDSAHRIIADSLEKGSDRTITQEATSKSTELQFGGVCFQREVVRRVHPNSSLESTQLNLGGAIFFEEETIPAVCGIRAIWVSPSNRRKGIATYLLDAVRRSFCVGSVLERSQVAFSQPTSAGRALASKFTGTGSFLVYKTS